MTTAEFAPAPKSTVEELHVDWLRRRVKESPFSSTYELTPNYIDHATYW